MKFHLFLLILCLILAATLRLVWLDRYPAGFNADEASFGYNAYSLLKTGRDEWATPSHLLPFTNLRSFGDYKLPLYAFLAIPSVKIFGLTEFATRLPNAALGTLAVFSLYLLANQLFPKSRPGLIAAFLLAISPWHISLSRGAFEANLASFFIPLSLYLFLTQRYLLSSLFFGINFYSYHSSRFLTPLLILVACWYAKPNPKKLLAPLLLLFILALPGLLTFFGPGKARVADVGIFHPTDSWQATATRRFVARNVGLPDPVARLFSNKFVTTLSVFTKNYFTYLSPQFLFTTGPSEAGYGMIPGRGVLYYIELPFLLIFFTIFVNKPSKSYLLLVSLAALTIIPAALSKGIGYTANRSAPMLTPLVIMNALGIIHLIKLVPKHSKLISVLTINAFLILFIFFAEDYLYHAPILNAPAMQYGWRQMMPRLIPIADRFSDVRFSRTLSEPHIFVAFYTKYPPDKYQKFTPAWLSYEKKGLTFLDQLDGYYLDKYRFGDIHPTDPVQHPTLYIAAPDQFPPDYPQYFQVDFPTGLPAIKVSEKLP